MSLTSRSQPLKASPARLAVHVKTEPLVPALIESGSPQEHMHDMRKYHQHVAIWGCHPSNHQLAPTVKAGPKVECTYIVDTHVSRAFLNGMTSLDLFPTMRDVQSRMDRDGVQADWQRVGADLRRAFNRLYCPTGAVKRERSA